MIKLYEGKKPVAPTLRQLDKEKDDDLYKKYLLKFRDFSSLEYLMYLEKTK